MQILEWAYQNDLKSYLVFEDDAIFVDDFEAQFEQFCNELPRDWEQVYLGGQLQHWNIHPPKRISKNVYIPYNVNRTHCFAVSRRGYSKLYKHLNRQFAHEEHIDHHLGRLHERGELRLYCPGKWLVGQDGGPSNVSGNINSATYYEHPESLVEGKNSEIRCVPAIWLQASVEVAVELERLGWHRGKWQNHDRYDHGVHNSLASGAPEIGLQRWYDYVILEARREDKRCVCLHHPQLTAELVSRLHFADFRSIIAATVEQAETELQHILQAA